MGSTHYRNFKTILLCCLLLLIATAAAAENRAGAFTVSPFMGRYMFDKHTDYNNDVLYGAGLGYNFTKIFALEASYGRVDTEYTPAGAAKIDTSLDLYRLEALIHLFPDHMIVPFIAFGGGLYSLSTEPGKGGRDNDSMCDYGGGVKIFLNPDVALRADVRQVLNFKGADDEYDSNWLWSGGFTLLFGGQKPAPEPVVEPPAPKDSDGDGVIDDLDKCPDTPMGVKVDKDGCPLDSDGDGVPDYLDKCPDTPAGVKVDKDGCPLDTDGDGVPDYLDKCPDTPKGTKVDATGCPIPAMTAKGEYDFGMIYFDFNKATLKPQSKPVLESVTKYLTDNPDVKVEIHGYTDNVGPKAYNQKLSEDRSKAVKKYLEEHGIAGDRLTTKGFGMSDPIDSNKTKEGRAKNRRINFLPVQ